MTGTNSHGGSTAMRLASYRDELRALGFDDEQAWTLVACAARDLHGLVVHAGYLAQAEETADTEAPQDAS